MFLNYEKIMYSKCKIAPSIEGLTAETYTGHRCAEIFS